MLKKAQKEADTVQFMADVADVAECNAQDVLGEAVSASPLQAKKGAAGDGKWTDEEAEDALHAMLSIAAYVKKGPGTLNNLAG